MVIFSWVFRLSLVGSIVFSVFMIVKAISEKHFNSSWHYKILVIILMLFLIPIHNFIRLPPRSKLNIPNLHIGEEKTLENTRERMVGQGPGQNGQIDKENLGYQVKNNPMRQNSSNIKYDINIFKNIFPYLWLLIGVIILLIEIVQYMRFRLLISKWSEKVKDRRLLNLFNACKDELNINKRVILRSYGPINSPILVGIFKPTVLIPNPREDHRRLKMIFSHELKHLKRWDILIKIVALLAKAIHWFNPLIYILLKEMDRYCEYSIDEKLVENMDLDDRKYYGETILSLAGTSTLDYRPLTTAMGSRGKQLKARLENMIYSVKMTRKKYIISFLMGILILVSGLTVACNILPANMEANNIEEDNIENSIVKNEKKNNEAESETSLEGDVIKFGKSFVNLFTGGVAKQNQLSFDKYISNENLLRFTDRMLRLTQAQDKLGQNTVNYGLENEFGNAILRQHPVDKLYYLELPFEFEGSGMTAKILVTNEDNQFKIVDFYFGTKDGIDTFTTGHPADRTIKNPNLWDDEEWVKKVFDKFEEFQLELDIPHDFQYEDPYANPPLHIELKAGKQTLSGQELDIYLKYRPRDTQVLDN